MAFLTQYKAKLCKILIITLVFEKNANFFAENCRKSQKIVIITLTPGHVRRFWDRTPEPKRLLSADPAPLSTTLKVERDFATGL
jgi:hypothetical protein